ARRPCRRSLHRWRRGRGRGLRRIYVEGKRELEAADLDDGGHVALLVVGRVVGRHLDLELVAGWEAVALGRDLEAGVAGCARSIHAAVRAAGHEALGTVVGCDV